MGISVTRYELNLYVIRLNQPGFLIRVKRIFKSEEEACEWIESKAWPDIFPGIPFEEYRGSLKVRSTWSSWDDSLKKYHWLSSQTLPHLE
jgi:hypothetical protein